ncbi:glutathione S-transferase family protein [Enterobacter ludwigii]|uniref:glutathione S-transferase family protein n=1 Tax=Enterobacter ludwigii TaxID=299767 RepID=UPI0005CFC0DD|nr:glutathione S-transferase family protein [Enterobacter ludwigii]MED5735439.1 glutathione S-transferase family protein [Enterobacter ludwigii]HDR2551093.1 glutathione S-transferase family protein [Enterobacter ludwigii]HDR2556346.1 glutathione S-transferase family protein [Enterobacter ludwigii]HDR2557734.1 glutathione S-transferase family protein [Enterobacter ludwigii]HDR2571885.1 glutathione S-transferase family protein [Enterobacter ludwigii]
MSTHDLTLISHPLCPFVQRSAIVLLEKNVPFDRVNVDLSAKPDWFLALSPTGKVPLLKVHHAEGEDAIIFESMVICEYLNETQDGDSLYADDALERARQRAWIEFSTLMLGNAWQFLNATDQAMTDSKRAVLREQLEYIESELNSGSYFSGSKFSMVDAIYAPVFRYFSIIDASVSEAIFEGLPRISAWKTALAKRESVNAAVSPDYAELFQNHLRQHSAILAA